MNTNSLETLLLQTLTEMKSGAEKVGNFAVEQAPDVFQQLLAYQFWSAVVFGLFVSMAALILGCFACRLWKANEGDDRFVSIFPALFCLIALAGALALGNKAMKIKIAPKVYVIEYTTQLIRGQ